VVATSSRDMGSVEVVFVSPDGAVTRPEIRRLSGPPDTVVAAVDAPEPGRWKVAVGESGRVVACDEVRVASSPPARERTTDAVWNVRNRWDEGFENLYAAFVESLFDYPVDEDLTWRSLHELTRDPQRNLLHDYYGGGEDEEFVLEPDCADLPYMLRAYFSWKMGLPFGFRQCSRGRAGQPPRCGNLRTNQEARSGGDDIDAFARFARRDVRSGVHSASGRTHPDDDDTDYYPVALTRESLRPGTLYADPYGHLLVIARWVPQGAHGPGVLIGADAQPDGTVGRRRFWRGSFLFSPRTEDAGAGFKAFRPLVARGDALVSLGNDDLRDDARFAPFSLEQYEGSTDDFYARMEALINPRSLDPETELLGLVDALEEAVARRVNSVDNGEVFMAERDFAPIEMPSGYAIFETSGAWENYSTPSRDMRMLISIDTVRMHPERVRATPARYGLPVEGAALDEAVAALEALLADELAERSFQYTRSDGSTWRLTLAEVVDRAADLEVAYNPNDCMELRWGADLASEEGATCDRRAPSAQTARMAEYRSWFATRTRPPR
jgi:hypothetical protein